MENQPHTENRKHKDSLFVDYFSKDRDWKQHFLSLYNALHGTNLQVETTKLERVNLEQVLYMDYYNDIAVMVNDQFILMIEHQSTTNPNMPLRLLEYVTRIYGNKVDSKAKFSDKLIPLAKPEFFVFYTGNQDLPPESYLYLSDAFPKQDTSDEASLPGVLGAGSPQAVLGKGEVLGGEKPRFRVEGLSPPKEITLELKEAYAEGISIGLERGAYQNKLETAQLMIGLGIPLEQVQLCTNLPLDVVQGLIQNQ